MKISIITVVYNGEKEINQTIESVLSQSISPFEYIIIDGKSTDRTLEYVLTYKGKFCQKGIGFKVLSESDEGLYDAMNKGIKMAKGDYIGFLNCGDWYEQDVLNVVKKYMKNNSDICYGTMRYWNDNGIVMDKPSKQDRFVSSRNWNHPTCFAKRDLYLTHLFNTDFGSYADFEWYVATRKKNVKISILPKQKIITNFRLGGVSNTVSVLEAMNRARNKYKAYKINGYGWIYYLESYIWELIKFAFMYFQKYKK